MHHKITMLEKLRMIKAMNRRNEQRRKEFAEKQARKERLFDMYERGILTEEEFRERMNKL